MKREAVEQTCEECGLTNLVTKNYNCTSCRAENVFEEPTKKDKKRGDKKWLS